MWRIHCKRSTVAISERRMHISREILRISLFSLMYGTTILTSIKFNNFGTQHLNRPRHSLHSFCCTTRHTFEPLHVYEPVFNMDKYVYMVVSICNKQEWFPWYVDEPECEYGHMHIRQIVTLLCDPELISIIWVLAFQNHKLLWLQIASILWVSSYVQLIITGHHIIH